MAGSFCTSTKTTSIVLIHSFVNSYHFLLLFIHLFNVLKNTYECRIPSLSEGKNENNNIKLDQISAFLVSKSKLRYA